MPVQSARKPVTASVRIVEAKRMMSRVIGWFKQRRTVAWEGKRQRLAGARRRERTRADFRPEGVLP